jgi:hypothetical protein
VGRVVMQIVAFPIASAPATFQIRSGHSPMVLEVL